MKTVYSLSLCAILLLTTASTALNVDLKDEKDKVSYSIGASIGKSLKEEKFDFNSDAFIAGLKDAQSGDKMAMTDEEMRQTVSAYQSERLKQLENEKKLLSFKTKADGIRYLEENKKKKDVVTLPSGLQYRVIKPGAGAHPKSNDVLFVHYTGKHIDGSEFDSSRSRGEAFQMSLSNVIPGWSEALKLMQPGAQWEIVIPSDLAYGELGAGERIPPNSTLIFDVELLSIKAQPGNSPAKAKKKPKAQIRS